MVKAMSKRKKARQTIDALSFEGVRAMIEAIDCAHFSGELSGLEARVENYSNPYMNNGDLGQFNIDLFFSLPYIRVFDNPALYGDVYTLARVIAHEMLHYYCYLHGIEDVQFRTNGQWHNEKFASAARRFGLYDEDFAEVRDQNGNLSEYFFPFGFMECVKEPDIDYSAFSFPEVTEALVLQTREETEWLQKTAAAIREKNAAGQ